VQKAKESTSTNPAIAAETPQNVAVSRSWRCAADLVLPHSQPRHWSNKGARRGVGFAAFWTQTPVWLRMAAQYPALSGLDRPRVAVTD